MRTIVISDIHGSFYTMKKLLDEVNFNRKNDKLICLGDMCDRGKNTKLVWEFFYNLQQENPQHVVLLGNHEDMFNLAIKEAIYSNNLSVRQDHYFRNSGLTTLQSFYPEATVETRGIYFKKFANEYFIHAGVDFTKNFWNQTHRDMIWIREPFLSSNEKYNKKVFHGHSPVKEEPYYEEKSNRINIDGGCVYGGKLNIVVIEEGDLKVKQSSIIKEDIYEK